MSKNYDVNTVSGRLKILLKEMDMNPNSFSVALGVTSPIIYNIVGGKMNKPSFDLLVKICNTFEQVNLEWLVLGTGAMFKDLETLHDFVSDSDFSDSSIESLEKEFERLESELESYKVREKVHLETISALSKR